MAKASGDVSSFITGCVSVPKTKWDTLSEAQRKFIRDVHAELKKTGTVISNKAIAKNLASKFGIRFSNTAVATIWAMLDGEK